MGGICKLFGSWWLCRQDVKIYCKALQFGISLQLDLIKVHIITMQIPENVCTESIESPVQGAPGSSREVQGGPGKSSRVESRIWSRAILNRTRDCLPWVPMTWPFFCAPSPLGLDFDGWINKIDVNGKAKAWPNMTKVLFGGHFFIFAFKAFSPGHWLSADCAASRVQNAIWGKKYVSSFGCEEEAIRWPNYVRIGMPASSQLSFHC